ncbi:efflux pump antibiotic resistance protein, putative [Talaromyces stipitatus ATCC 10500]|uniref:Efflux pump antibiotic resistance protein, putative n=1 Tax=Talaromyces stipitatus (strain ATCC 10500 / CBS 375.48 / QM 6759 / NRRL 1006) TaxID=441959 RepID=B8M0G4_TALSN|nr:efflux pump antibiotic resistance protein, putative [Talaromyces stipitatus ATCC 10500]EED21261.1 efflux pump antibiotic resistance protein, putative [Talaromyces stipitatus ATCC 10500]
MELKEDNKHSSSDSTSSSPQPPSNLTFAGPQEHNDNGGRKVSSVREYTILPAEEVEYPSGFRLWITMVAMMLSIFLIAMDMTIVATSVPAITNEFNGIKDQAWYASSFFLTSGGFQSTWGKIYQNFPLKISFLTAIFIFEVGSTICAAAPSSVAFIVGRAIAGVGAAGVGSGSYTIVAFISEPKKRANFVSMLGAIFGIGSVLGPLIGGAFSTNVTWRWCFYINLPIGIPPVLAIIFFFRTPTAARSTESSFKTKLLQMDPLGLSLLLGGIVTYLLAVQYGGTSKPWNSGTVIGLLVTSVVVFILFGIVEFWQGESATVIPRLFKKPFVGMSMVYISFQGGALFSMVYYLPLYFQAILGDSAVLAGAHNLAFIVPAMISVLVAGIIVTNTGMITAVMTVGSAIGALGCGLCSLFGLDTTIGVWIGVQIVAGVGLGLGFQVPLTTGQASVQESDLPAVTSMLLEFQTLGGAIWVSASQAVFINRMLIVLPELAPNVNPRQVIATGAGDLRTVFDPEQLPGILTAYSQGIKDAYLLICALIGVSMFVAASMPWKKLDINVIEGAGDSA